MNKKEILMICFIIAFIFSLQAVVAAEADLDEASLTAQDSDVVLSSSNVSAYALPSTDNQLDAINEVSFNDLQTIVDNDGAGFEDHNYTWQNGDSQVTISSSITLDGKGKVIIDAQKNSRIFNILSGNTVTLKGITFINGNADGNGGAILSNGILTIENCNFIDNEASGHGGAVYLDHPSSSTISGSNFENNVAGLNGGAIDWSANSVNGKVTDSTFTNNIAKRSGGAIHWSGHYGTISNSEFTNNKATGEVTSEIGGIIGGGDGGAVLWVGSHGIINDGSKFENNYAKNRGGAVFLHGNSTENCTNTTIDTCTFEDNVAGVNGGALDWNEGSHDGNVLHSTFTNNVAGSNGGAIFWSGHHGEILHSTFTNNTAKGNCTDAHGNIGDGGAIIWSGINGTVDDCRFINNNANKRGGAVFLQNCTHGYCDNTTFDNSYFKNNTAGTNGGALDWQSGASHGRVMNSIFEDNTAMRSGGAIYWSGHNGTIEHSDFTNNRALGKALGPMPNGTLTYGGDAGAVMWTGAIGSVDYC